VFESVDAVKTVSGIQTNMFKIFKRRVWVFQLSKYSKEQLTRYGKIDASAGLPKDLQDRSVFEL